MKNIKKNNSILFLAVLLLGVIFAAATFTKAYTISDEQPSFFTINDDDDDDDGIDDDKEDLNERKIEIELDSDEAKISSEFESNSTENEIEIEIKAEDDSLRIKYEYSTEIDDNETELEFSIKFFEIIEYIDNNNDSMYDDSIDTAVQIYELGDFKPIAYLYENLTQGELYTFTVTTIDDVFTAKIYATGEFLEVGDTLITPTEIKVDLIISNFPYIDDESALALNVKLEVEGEVEYDEETEDEEYERSTLEKELEINVNDYLGFFSWSEISLVDGVERPVLANFYDNEGSEQKLYLNYYRGDLIIHDPKIGVMNVLNLGPTNLFSLSLFTIGGISLLVVFSIALVGLRKLKRK